MTQRKRGVRVCVRWSFLCPCSVRPTILSLLITVGHGSENFQTVLRADLVTIYTIDTTCRCDFHAQLLEAPRCEKAKHAHRLIRLIDPGMGYSARQCGRLSGIKIHRFAIELDMHSSFDDEEMLIF